MIAAAMRLLLFMVMSKIKLKKLRSAFDDFRESVESNQELGVIFNAPCDPKKISDFESTFDWQFSDEIRAMLLTFDGEDTRNSSGACGGFKFCGLKMMMEVYSMARDVSETVTHRVIPSYAPFVQQIHSWQDHWLPIAEDHLGCDALYIDYEPSKMGKPGQMFIRDRDHSISGIKAFGIPNLIESISNYLKTNNRLPNLRRDIHLVS